MKRILINSSQPGTHIADFLAEHPQALRSSESPYANISGVTDTVAEEIAFGLENQAVPLPQMREQVHRITQKLGISHLLNQHPLKLSGGQTQRLALASIAVLGDNALVLEHPLQGLDAEGRRLVLTLIANYPGDVLWTCPTQPGEDEYAVATRVLKDKDMPVQPEGKKVSWDIQAASFTVQNLDVLTPLETQLGLKKKKRGRLLQMLSLSTQPGEILAVTGANGAGKTTVLRTLAGLLPATAPLKVGGQDIRHLKPPQRVKHLSFAAQHPRYQILTTSAAIEVMVGRAASAQRYGAQLLAATGLEHNAETNPYDLTLSQQQMLSVACALAPSPSVLLLDEPSASLTVTDCAYLVLLLKDYAAHGGTVIFTSHDQGLIEAVATRHQKLSSATS